MYKNNFILGKISLSITILIVIISLFKSYSFATNEQTIVKDYEVIQSKENEFLENIYNSETDDTKIKSINKNISKNNYANKEITETKILTSNYIDYIYQEFGQTREYIDEEYQGTITISDIQIETIDNGYYETINEKVLEFSNYTDNDLNNIEKEIVLDDTTYYLINVNWETDETEVIDGAEIPITYKGSKVYQTIQKVNYANTYNVTVTYSGQVERIDTIYEYSVMYEKVIKTVEEDNIEEEDVDTNVVPVIIISGIGLTVLAIFSISTKNTYIYSKTEKGYKLIKRKKLSNKCLIIDITNCKNKSNNDIYAIKVNSNIFKKLKGRTISVVLGSKKKDIVLWNNYYEIKL